MPKGILIHTHRKRTYKTSYVTKINESVYNVQEYERTETKVTIHIDCCVTA